MQQEKVMQGHSMYLRTQRGDVFYAESLEEALSILTGEDGYRLTISDEQGNEIVVRISGPWEDDGTTTLEARDSNVRVRTR